MIVNETPAKVAASQSAPAEADDHSAPHWLVTFVAEFDKETDRAAVILTAAMLDDLLCEILKARLVPCAGSSDPLFDDANAPLVNFSSRIEMVYRLGLITHRFARDLHLVRKIRNSFAHDVSGCHFNDLSVRNRVAALEQSMEVNDAKLSHKVDPKNPRTMFNYMCGYMLWQLHKAKASLRCLDTRDAIDDCLPKKE